MMKTYVNKMKHGMLIASSPSPRPDDSDDDEAKKKHDIVESHVSLHMGHDCALMRHRAGAAASPKREKMQQSSDAVAFTTMMLDTIPERDTAKSRCTLQ